MIARSVRLLPDPDSPTMASASPRSSENETPRTAQERRPVAAHLDREALDLEKRGHSGRNRSASPSPSSERPTPVRRTAMPGKAASHWSPLVM